MTDNGVALLCSIHPASTEKQERILQLLRSGSKNYYQSPSSQCTTWTYMTPYPPPKNSSSAKLIISGLEIYTNKSALQKQIDDAEFFQSYHKIVKSESLYSRDEELVAWYLHPSIGFLSRSAHATPFGDGNLISQSLFVSKNKAEDVLSIIEGFTPFVRDEEPGVLSYAVFTRPKAPKEVLLVVRYRDRKAMMGHSKAKEHVDVVKKIMPLIENDMGKSTTMWQEIDDSFVSTKAGGPGNEAKL